MSTREHERRLGQIEDKVVGIETTVLGPLVNRIETMESQVSKSKESEGGERLKSEHRLGGDDVMTDRFLNRLTAEFAQSQGSAEREREEALMSRIGQRFDTLQQVVSEQHGEEMKRIEGVYNTIYRRLEADNSALNGRIDELFTVLRSLSPFPHGGQGLMTMLVSQRCTSVIGVLTS